MGYVFFCAFLAFSLDICVNTKTLYIIVCNLVNLNCVDFRNFLSLQEPTPMAMDLERSKNSDTF